MKSKQVIVVRKDLNMRKGKIASQASHSSMKVILDMMSKTPGMKYINSDGKEGEMLMSLRFEADTPLNDWLSGKFTKICVSVDSEQELVDIYNKGLEMGIPCSLILDAGLTEFGGVPTLTCCAIGPDWDDRVNEVTGGLKLL